MPQSNTPPATAEQILQERARALASTGTATHSDSTLNDNTETLHIVRFEFGQHRFAVERQYLVQVAQSVDITPLPATPDCLVGLVNLRGKIFPVYNLLNILGYAEPGITDSHQILHVHAADIDICILADKVSAAEALPISALQPAVDSPGKQAEEFIRGITAEQLVVVDVAAILGSHAIVIQH